MDAMHNLQQLKYYDLKHTIDDLQINGPQKIQLEEACKNATNEYLGLREENNRRLYNLCPEKMKRVNSPCYRGSPEEAFDISQQYLLSQLKINQPEIQHTEAQTLHTLQQQRTLPKDIQTQMFLPQNEGAPQPNQQTFQKCFGNQQHLPLHQYMPTNVVAQPQTDLVLNNQFDHNQLLQNSNIEPLNLFNNMPPYYSGYHQSEDDGIVEKRTLDEYQNLPENVARQKGKNIVQDHQLRGNVSGPLNGHGVQVPGTTTNFPPPIFNSDYVDDDQANELMPMIFSQNKQLNMNPALNPQMLHPFTQNFHSQMPEKGQHSMEYASHSLQSNPPSHSQGNIQNLLSFSSDPINANLGNIFNTYPPIHLNFY
uniref:Uncharacterized protein n=1 Tax=Meloidogyne hapla TaxID=6305 RepID=A0A1I8BV27_MELHA